MKQNHENPVHAIPVAQLMQLACKRVAPFWSLENMVAVNPYLGLSHLPFEEAAELLGKTASIQLTMPLSFYLEQLEAGQITPDDVKKALSGINQSSAPDEHQFIRSLKPENKSISQKTINLVTDVASETTRKNWHELFIDRITSWASVYFDKGQASWKVVNQDKNLFASWREYALADATPQIMGLKSFPSFISNLPEEAQQAAAKCVSLLKIPEEALENYLHALLLRVGGWSSYVAGLDWDSNLYGGKKNHLSEFLTILLCWEAAMLASLKEKNLENHWYKAAYELPELLEHTREDSELQQRLILHQAFELANREKWIALFNSNQNRKSKPKTTPLVQAVFCIDVRSEVFRRNLELMSSRIETLGFAGFFGFPVKYVPLAHNKGQNQCPALIPSAVTVKEVVKDIHYYEKTVQHRKLSHHLEKTWKSFKQGAVSNFSFVSPLGISYLPKLFLDTFGWTRPVPHPRQYGLSGKAAQNLTLSIDFEEHRHETTGIPLNDQVRMARSALKGMSLTSGFARLVLIAGHGSSTVNNPHASGLDCGACGGHAGDVNAQVAALVLNHPQVRTELAKQGITIPADTHFLAGLHDTTTDVLKILNEDTVPPSHHEDLGQLKIWLDLAGHAARTERAARFHQEKNENIDSGIFKRSKDWSQVRPEWGLAGCHAFVVAPRERTSGLNLDGKSFLHTYDWKKDDGFSVLELIMTAPMVVTSWINLQYFASTVDNKNLGAGNKTLHNVTAGIGVLEGYSGDLRIGLPWQSVHDGEKYQHLPYRLNVIIEAPLEAMNAILTKHPNVKNLCDNGWIHLLAMNEQGKISHHYAGDNEWEPLMETPEEVLIK